MKKDNDKLEIEFNKSFKENFNKKSLDKDFYKSLEKRIEDEKVLEKSIKGKINKFLNKEIEIDIKSVIAAAIVLFSLPTIFSLKEIDSSYVEKIRLTKALENRVDKKINIY